LFRPGGRTILLCRKMCIDKIERIGDYVSENIVLAVRRCAFFFLISGDFFQLIMFLFSFRAITSKRSRQLRYVFLYICRTSFCTICTARFSLLYRNLSLLERPIVTIYSLNRKLITNFDLIVYFQQVVYCTLFPYFRYSLHHCSYFPSVTVPDTDGIMGDKNWQITVTVTVTK
jgi:hypothetical protein